MGRIDRMTKMTNAAAASLSPNGPDMKGERLSGDGDVPSGCSPLLFRPLARATVLPPESSSSSCPSCPSCLLQFAVTTVLTRRSQITETQIQAMSAGP